MSGQVWLDSPHRSLLWGPNILIQAYIVFNQPKHKNRQFSTVFFGFHVERLTWNLKYFALFLSLRYDLIYSSCLLTCCVTEDNLTPWFSCLHFPNSGTMCTFHHIYSSYGTYYHIHNSCDTYTYTVHVAHTTTYTVHVALWFCSMLSIYSMTWAHPVMKKKMLSRQDFSM